MKATVTQYRYQENMRNFLYFKTYLFLRTNQFFFQFSYMNHEIDKTAKKAFNVLNKRQRTPKGEIKNAQSSETGCIVYRR